MYAQDARWEMVTDFWMSFFLRSLCSRCLAAAQIEGKWRLPTFKPKHVLWFMNSPSTLGENSKFILTWGDARCVVYTSWCLLIPDKSHESLYYYKD